jgi:Fe-S-cluster containining protein
MALSLVSSFVIFICCNCGQCCKTRIIRGRILLAPNLNIISPQEPVAYIIQVSPSAPLEELRSQESYYPSYQNPFEPPPTYDESQGHYK